MTLKNLDDTQLYALDPSEMGKFIAGFANQCRAAWQNVAQFEPPAPFRDATHVLILGVGGSAIGGDLLRVLVGGQCAVPITVSREYDLPMWVNAQTLVIAASHSGNTEETLAAFAQARTRGAMLLAITTGGKVVEVAREAGAATLTFDFKSQPRAALGYSLVSLLGVFARLGWIKDPARDLEQALRGVEALTRTLDSNAPAAQNLAKQLAQKLYGRLPIVYGSGVLGEAAHRWKTQLNENAKVTACYDLMSELNHNAVVGYEFPKSVLAKTFFVVLTSQNDHPQIKKRFKITCELLKRNGLPYETVEVKGESVLAEMLWAIHLGDFVSYYLGLLNGVDPTPVTAIDFLKGALAERG